MVHDDIATVLYATVSCLLNKHKSRKNICSICSLNIEPFHSVTPNIYPDVIARTLIQDLGNYCNKRDRLLA